ncbi:MAG: hypothetical protein M0C28_41540 [Candidatus Moduliflexus flocculans]|nr:hypothetical protein [Candidatus Moduliflexus flocculans]
MVHVDGQVLVQGKIARGFEMTSGSEDDGYGRAVWADTGLTSRLPGRRPRRPVRAPRRRHRARRSQSLDTMTLTFTDLVNEAHRRGLRPERQDGHWTSSPNSPASTTWPATTTGTATAPTTPATSTA